MCYIKLTAHPWQQAWFSTLHCEPAFSLHPLVSQHGSNSWQFFRKKWKEKGNFMWIKTFSQSEAWEGGCLYLHAKNRDSFFVQVIFPKWSLVRTFIRTGFKWNIYFCQKWSLLWNWLMIISYLQSESHLHIPSPLRFHSRIPLLVPQVHSRILVLFPVEDKNVLIQLKSSAMYWIALGWMAWTGSERGLYYKIPFSCYFFSFFFFGME